MDFLNKNQKVYIAEEEKKVFLEKLKRDVEVMVGVLWEMALCPFFAPHKAVAHSQYEGTPPLPFGFSACRGVGYES